MQTARVSLQEALQGLNLIGRSLIPQPQEDHSPVGVMLPVDLLTKIFVVGDQDTILVDRDSEDGLIGDSTSFLEDGEHFMTLLSQPSRDPWPRAFVDEETHLWRCGEKRHEG